MPDLIPPPPAVAGAPTSRTRRLPTTDAGPEPPPHRRRRGERREIAQRTGASRAAAARVQAAPVARGLEGLDAGDGAPRARPGPVSAGGPAGPAPRRPRPGAPWAHDARGLGAPGPARPRRREARRVDGGARPGRAWRPPAAWAAEAGPDARAAGAPPLAARRRGRGLGAAVEGRAARGRRDGPAEPVVVVALHWATGGRGPRTWAGGPRRRGGSGRLRVLDVIKYVSVDKLNLGRRLNA